MINHLFCPKCNNNLIKEKYSYWHLCNDCQLQVYFVFKEKQINNYYLWFNFNSIDYWCEIIINSSGLYNYYLFGGSNSPNSSNRSRIANAEVDINNINNLYNFSLSYINNLIFL